MREKDRERDRKRQREERERKTEREGDIYVLTVVFFEALLQQPLAMTTVSSSSSRYDLIM